MDGVVGLMNIEDYCQLSKDWSEPLKLDTLG